MKSQPKYVGLSESESVEFEQLLAKSLKEVTQDDLDRIYELVNQNLTALSDRCKNNE
jgi:hypothetical protein